MPVRLPLTGSTKLLRQSFRRESLRERLLDLLLLGFPPCRALLVQDRPCLWQRQMLNEKGAARWKAEQEQVEQALAGRVTPETLAHPVVEPVNGKRTRADHEWKAA